MLDTVTVGIGGVGVPGASALQARGWDYHTSKAAEGGKFNAWATTQRAGVALKYGAGFDWVSATASLPKLLRGVNDVLLPWDECRAALEMMVGVTADALGVALPPLDAWKLSRVDPVWAWAVDPAPYLLAVRLGTIPRCDLAVYPGGVQWRTPKKHTRVRVYDKRKESKRDVDLPFRVEAEVRPGKKQVWWGARVDASVGAWEARTALGIVGGVVHRLGLDRPVVTPLHARTVLIDAYGQRQGINTWRALLDALASGGWANVPQSADTINRHLRRLRNAGLSAVSPVGELPPLALPPSCPKSHVA